MAERAGVAISSVSRVLGDYPDVSPRMREAVMAAVTELHYRPNMLARGLRRKKSYSVGYVVSDISNPVLAETVMGTEGRLRAAGYSLLLTNSGSDPQLDVTNIQLLEERRVDGLILSLSREDFPELGVLLDGLEVPFVLVDRDAPSGMLAWQVVFDHRTGMAAAADHLVELGHRHFGIILGGPRRPADQRRRGVEEALAKVRRTTCQVVDGPFSVEHGAAAMRDLLRADPSPTAVVAGGNLLMHGALRVLHERGREVGRDVSFVGCDDVAIAELHRPRIAVVRRDLRAMGVAAAEMMLEALVGAGPPRQEVLPTEFVAAPSCGELRDKSQITGHRDQAVANNPRFS